MKILIPIFGFGASGGGRVLSELANHWITYGHKVSFIAFEDSMDPFFPTTAEIIWIDNFGRKKDSNKSNGMNFPLKYFFTRHSLKKAINRYGKDYDIVLATQSLTAFPVFYSKIRARKFYYIQAYEPEYYEYSGLKSIFYKNAAISSYKFDLQRIVNAELYLDYKEIKTDKFVYPGIDLNKYYPKVNLFSDINEKLIVGCVGRIQKFKGTQLVIDAFEILSRKYKKVELHIAFGNKELSDKTGIKIFKPTNDDELAEFYRSVDILIAPGTIQIGAIHYPVLEAMACGTTVITTGYSRANQDNSYIVPVNNAEDIVDRIADIIENKHEAANKANKAKKNVKDFSWDIVSKKMLSYFNEAM